MKQPEIKAALIRALEDEMDSPLAAFGYHRPPKGLVYSRREGGVKCQFAFEFASNPSCAVGAIAHLTPTLRTANAQISALALQLTEDPWLLANAPDVIQNQRLTLVTKPHMPEWYLANFSQVRDATEGILGKFIERGRAFLEDYSTPGGIVSQYEAGDSRGLFQQHYHVYVIAASLLEGRADVAKTILEDKFSKPGVKKRFEALWRNVNAGGRVEDGECSQVSFYPMIQAGNRVRFVRMPNWVADLPEESRRIFEFCLGRIYLVKEIEERGLCVLDVSLDVDERFGGFLNDLRLEEDCLERL